MILKDYYMARSDINKVIGKATCIKDEGMTKHLEVGRIYDVVKIHNNDYDPLLSLEFSIDHYRVTVPMVYSSRFKLDFDLKAAMILHGIEADDKF